MGHIKIHNVKHNCRQKENTHTFYKFIVKYIFNEIKGIQLMDFIKINKNFKVIIF
jgi:hypothetical protein